MYKDDSESRPASPSRRADFSVFFYSLKSFARRFRFPATLRCAREKYCADRVSLGCQTPCNF